jgi:hypothetical protein
MDDPPMRDTLSRILPTIMPGLIRPSASDSLLDVAGRFPSDLTRWVGMECRLDPADRQVDFGFIVSRSARNTYLQVDPTLAQPPFSWNHPVWARLREFFLTWGQPGSYLDRHILSAVFEFDLPGPAGSTPLPGFFFGTSSLTSDTVKTGGLGWVTDQAIPLLLGEPLPPGVQGALERCTAYLPPGAHLYQVGVFFSRPGAPLRICIDGISSSGIHQYLQSVGYTAPLGELETVLAELTGLCEIGIDLDIAEQVQPKICLECSQPKTSFFEEPHRYADLLDHLVEKGWCSPEKQLAVLAYPGIIEMTERSTSAPPKDQFTSIDKEIMLIKLVYQPGKPMRAKAYLQAVRTALSPVEQIKQRLAYSAREDITRTLISKREAKYYDPHLQD